MTTAGFQVLAGRIPGERIATSVITSDSATFTTTETEVATVTASLVSGRTYQIVTDLGIGSSVANDSVRCFLHEDTLGGQTLDQTVVGTDVTTGGTRKVICHLESEFTASSSGDKTFVIGAERINGSGNCQLIAASNRPTYVKVHYVSG